MQELTALTKLPCVDPLAGGMHQIAENLRQLTA
jgi:hypothetical protein